jgi:ATP-binding cassette subfamily C protein/ATP-binding cassette subfamily C protein EexD
MLDGVTEQQPCHLGTALRACRRSFVAAGFFSLLANLLVLAVPIYMLQVYDRVLTSRSTETLVYLTLLALGALLTLGLFDLVRGRLLSNAGAWLEQRLAPAVFERAIQAPLRGSAYRTEAATDLAQLRAFIGGPGILALFDAPWVPLFVATAYLLHPVIGILAIAGAVALFALAALNDVVTRRPLRAANEAAMLLHRQLEANSRNAEVIEAMGMMSRLAGRWSMGKQHVLRLLAGAAGRAGLLLSASKFARLAIQVLVLAVGAWLVLQDELTPGAMIASAIIMTRALAPVEQAIGTSKQIVAVRAAAQRLDALLGETPFRPAAMPLPAPRGDVAVEDLAYAVPCVQRQILRTVSFNLAAGEALAVIGPSAAGKSTLARLLVGVIPPSAGHVRLDGADVFAWNRDAFGRCIGYLPQDIELFDGTVAANIARMAEADPARIVEAARKADVHDMILQLPQGYDTQIGEGGTHLSGGQRQRIALARALFGDPKLVVLDEPNANLDRDGEAALMRAFAGLKEQAATLVLITHRPALVANVDKVLLLRNGTTELFGPRQEVLARVMPQAFPLRGAPASKPIAATSAS